MERIDEVCHMNIEMYIIGMIFCAMTGVIDRNPSMLRFIGVILFQSIGVYFILKAQGI